MADLSRRLQDALAGRYRIERELGRGGMATVFLAEDLRHGRRVAIKVLGSGVAAAIDPLRFHREIEIAARLAHPHILPLFDSGNAEDLYYYVMPHVTGESLRQRIERERMLALEDALRIAREVAGALAYAHREGVVHRDVKPENILLQEGHALVADFGIARSLTSGDTDPLAPTRPLGPVTGAGLTIGTPAYMSPEQAAGSRSIDGRSDQYSLGCVVYEMIAGQPPFVGPTAESLMHQHLRLEPRPLGALRGSVPEAVGRAVGRALAKTPADRFPTVAEFYDALGARTDTAASATDSAAVPAAGGALRSLAVLPLENLSGDAGQDYFADGMTEALIATLGRLGALRVISRTSVMTYKGARKPIPVIARELNVQAIVEGTVLTVGDQVRISAQLVSARDDAMLWSESFDRDLRNVLSLQSEVARAIASAVHLRLTRAERSQLASGRQVDPEVYRREQMGRHVLAQRTIAGLRLAVEHFREAVAIDPGYAPAQAGLSEALLLLSNYGVEPPASTHRPAREAADRAIALDPSLPEGHVSLALIHWQYEWNFGEAARRIEHAISLSAGSANARYWHSVFLGVAGRFEEALAENRRAQDLDPLSHIIVTIEGWIRAFEGRDDLAIERLEYVLKLVPSYVPALLFLGLSLARSGRGEEGVGALEQAVETSHRLPRALAYLCHACARAGRRDQAATLVAELEERSRSEYVPPYFLAIANAAVGEADRAFEWLERGYAGRDVMMRDLGVDIACEPLRRDPRGMDVLRRMGLTG